MKHEIDTGDARPVRQRLRQQTPAHQATIDSHIQSMLRQKIIAPAQSPWSANLVMVKESSGEFRACYDFRNLNSLTKKDAYCLPRIDDCLRALAGATWLTTFDLKNSYYQVDLAEKDREKTSFVVREASTVSLGYQWAYAIVRRRSNVWWMLSSPDLRTTYASHT